MRSSQSMPTSPTKKVVLLSIVAKDDDIDNASRLVVHASRDIHPVEEGERARERVLTRVRLDSEPHKLRSAVDFHTTSLAGWPKDS